MHIHCRSCGQTEFRVSRLRRTDLIHLLLLQYPVRCRTCKMRKYAFILQALNLPPAKPRHLQSTKL